MEIFQSVKEENILRLIIDEREYLFKLSDQHDSNYLKKLAAIVERKIKDNKSLFNIKDYQKVLMLTCLNLAEDMLVLEDRLSEAKQASIKEDVTPSAPQEPAVDSTGNILQNLELIDRLETIRTNLESASSRSENKEGN